MDQECARPACRIEYAEVRDAFQQVVIGCIGLVMMVCSCCVSGEAGECALERICDDRFDECGRCVESSASVPFIFCHEAFEGSAEHFRVDGSFGPAVRVFACGESVFVEEFGYEDGDGVIGEADGAPNAFGLCWREESAIEERNIPEGSRGVSASGGWSVERTEEEWFEERVMESTSGVEVQGALLDEEVLVVVEPAFGLKESEEECSGGIEECEFAPFCVGSLSGGGSSEQFDGLVEFFIEAC